jgi:hypothetical protein
MFASEIPRVGTSQISCAGIVLSTDSVPCFNKMTIFKRIADYTFEKPYSDSFADYTNTQMYIHLPYIGTYPIDPHICVSKIIVDYYVDVETGDCVAKILLDDGSENGKNPGGNGKYLYEFKGNCGRKITLRQRDNFNTIAARNTMTALGTLV